MERAKHIETCSIKPVGHKYMTITQIKYSLYCCLFIYLQLAKVDTGNDTSGVLPLKPGIKTFLS